MRYGQIRPFDIANGEGVRTSVFVTGCTHLCQGCFNVEYQDFNYGNEWTNDITKSIITMLGHDRVSGLTILGGEPMDNAKDLIRHIEIINEYVDKPIWIYSGYTFSEIMHNEDMFNLLILCDILVDGRFVESEKDLTLQFKGSRNQRIINIQKTLKYNEINLWDRGDII